MLGGIAALAAAALTSHTVVHADAFMGRALRAAGSELSPHVSYMVSSLGGTDLVVPLTAASALLLCVLRHWGGALMVVFAVASTQAVVDLMKLLVERPRPALNGGVAEASGFSFPSAHSATSMALYASLAFLAARACRGKARAAIAGAGATVVLAVGASRVLLAAHYPIDVLAGWLTGAALVVGSWLAFRRFARPAAQPA
jgi:membrane-associated phospholipid phosphatase